MQLYIYLIIRTRNPDLRSSRASVLSCFGPLVLRSSMNCPIYMEGARYREMSRVLRCYIIRILFASFKKGSMRPFIKRFYKLSSRIFMGFYFQSCRESFFSASCHFWKGVYDAIHQKVFQVIIQNIYGFLFLKVERKCFLIKNRGLSSNTFMVYYITFIIRTRNPDLRSSCFGHRASVLVLRSSCFGPRA